MKITLSVPVKGMITGKIVTKKVAAERIGMLAVHRRIDDSNLFDWTVAHIPTGYVCLRAHTKTQALRLARKLSKVEGIDFSISDPAYFRELPAHLLDEIRALRIEALET